MFCPNCGKEVNAGSRFCPKCGHAVLSVPEAGPKSPPSATPASADMARKRFPRIAVISTVSSLLIVAVILILVFVVLRGGTGSVMGNPQETVEKLFQAIEQGDAEVIASLLTPELIEQLENSYIGRMYGSSFVPGLRQLFFDLENYGYNSKKAISFRGLSFDTKIQGNTATVTVTGGVAFTTYGYWEVTWDLTSYKSEGDGYYEGKKLPITCPIVFNLVGKNGKWLISGCSLLDHLNEYRHSFEELYDETHYPND